MAFASIVNGKPLRRYFEKMEGFVENEDFNLEGLKKRQARFPANLERPLEDRDMSGNRKKAATRFLAKLGRSVEDHDMSGNRKKAPIRFLAKLGRSVEDHDMSGNRKKAPTRFLAKLERSVEDHDMREGIKRKGRHFEKTRGSAEEEDIRKFYKVVEKGLAEEEAASIKAHSAPYVAGANGRMLAQPAMMDAPGMLKLPGLN